MTLNDLLAATMSKMLNAEHVGKHELIIKPISKLMTGVLDLLKANNYIKQYTIIKDSKGNYLTLTLSGNINKCGVIKPRHAVKKSEYEKFEKRFLIANNFGIIIVSTPQGIMVHTEAKKKGLGGKLIAYCY